MAALNSLISAIGFERLQKVLGSQSERMSEKLFAPDLAFSLQARVSNYWRMNTEPAWKKTRPQ